MQAVVDFRRLGPDFAAFVADPTTETSVEYATRMGLKVSHTREIRGKRYHIVRYDKTKYAAKENGEPAELPMTEEIAMLRSVIISEGKIRCVSLPKATRAMADVPAVSPGKVHPSKSVLLEGPMMNLFYYKDSEGEGDDNEGKCWQMSTRSVFGARNSFYDDGNGNKLTFRNMFLEAMPDALTSTLDRSTVYSYVIRHPKNRDVYGVDQPYLVLAASFKPTDESHMVWEYVAPDVAGVLAVSNIPSMGTTAAWADESGNLVRAKQLNDEYMTMRKLRGTQPKLKFHFLTLRKQRGALTQYLAAFPEHATVFSAFRDEIHNFTKQLQTNYWECFVRRAKPLKEYDGRFKTHMYNLHSGFKVNRNPVNLSKVIQYVNNLEPAQLMAALNWEHRSRNTRRGEGVVHPQDATNDNATPNDMEQ